MPIRHMAVRRSAAEAVARFAAQFFLRHDLPCAGMCSPPASWACLWIKTARQKIFVNDHFFENR
ncbi:hypothetical protein, partial [Aquamicrobium sp. LC103]|uniref:hypothetical protein n=1 Tax=Aquamicrobium sp. LC103 TaxID=1120658 RepID=UPI00198026D4